MRSHSKVGGQYFALSSDLVVLPLRSSEIVQFSFGIGVDIVLEGEEMRAGELNVQEEAEWVLDPV